MREMGFSRKDWMNYLTNTPKLEESFFTTYRFPRKDSDWEVRENVTIVYKPRTKDREVLGTARITWKAPKFFFYHPHGLFKERIITDEDARADGFRSSHEMYLAFVKMHGKEKIDGSPILRGPYDGKLNKLTLFWIKRADPPKRKYFPHVGGRRNQL